MTTAPRANGKSPHKERRSGGDRRLIDKGPVGKHDWRKRIDERQPEVKELHMSRAEWAALSQELPVQLE